MSGRIRTRLAIFVALAALVAVVVPAGLAVGDHGGSGVVGPGGTILLSMGNGNGADVIEFDDLTPQPIPTAKNDCTAVDALGAGGAGAILVVEELNSLSLGERKDHIGTQGPGDGAGEPCARVQAGAGTEGGNEGISVSLGEAVGDVTMTGFDLDIRLKFNSAVTATTHDAAGVLLETFYSPATDGSDNGPDSEDNYRWHEEATEGKAFVEVRFVATAGAFALGGGKDNDEAGSYDTSHTGSQFQVSREFDGEITCGDTHTIVDPAFPDITGVVTVHAIDELGTGVWITSGCLLKLFDEEVASTALAFVPEHPTASARYTIEVTIENQPITVDGGGTITSLVAEYNLDGDLSFPAASTNPLQSCQIAPPTTDPADPGHATFWGQADPLTVPVSPPSGGLSVFPTGEAICFYSANVTPTGVDGSGNTIGTETWGIAFIDDPGARFR